MVFRHEWLKVRTNFPFLQHNYKLFLSFSCVQTQPFGFQSLSSNSRFKVSSFKFPSKTKLRGPILAENLPFTDVLATGDELGEKSSPFRQRAFLGFITPLSKRAQAGYVNSVLQRRNFAGIISYHAGRSEQLIHQIPQIPRR